MNKRVRHSRATSAENTTSESSAHPTFSLGDYNAQQPIGPVLEIDESLSSVTAGLAVLFIMVEPHDAEARRGGLAKFLLAIEERRISRLPKRDRPGRQY